MVGSDGQRLLIGRRQELEILLSHLDAARLGESRVVLIGGEPGVGKTRLVTELADYARSSGWQVLLGSAYETEGMPAYVPIIEALQDYVRACPASELPAQLGRSAGDIGLLVPEVRDLASGEPDSMLRPPVGPAHERYHLFESVNGFLMAIAASAQSGLLLVLDDLHWADQPTLLLLRHLLHRLSGTRVLIAGAYRTVGVSRTHPLTEVLSDLRRKGTDEPLLLGPFSAAETNEYVQVLNGSAAAPGLVRSIHHWTRGNPFFVRQVVLHLQAEHLDLTVARSESDLGMPEGVKQVIGTRLARLSADANSVLEAAAVLGDGAPLELIEGMSESDANVLAEALEEAQIAGMIREDGEGYRFSHPLVRQTLYEELSLPRRRRLHQRAALAIESVHAHNVNRYLGPLAVHYRLAGVAAEIGKAIEYSIRAGEAARSVFAWEDAAMHWKAAIGLMEQQGGEPGRRADLQQRLGDLLFATGLDHAAGIEQLEAALKLWQAAGARETAAELESSLGRALSTFPATRDIPRAVAHFRSAESVLSGSRESAVLVDLYTGISVAAYWSVRTDESMVAARRALDIAEQLGDTAAWTNAATFYGNALVSCGRLAEGFSLLDQAWQTADRLDNTFLSLQAAWLRNLCTWLGDPRDAIYWYQLELSRPRLKQAPDHRHILLGVLGWAHALTGELDLARSVVEALGSGSDWFTAWPDSHIAFRGDDWQRAEALWSREREKARRSGDRMTEWVTVYWLGRLEMARGRYADAERLLLEGLTIMDGQLQQYELWNLASLALLYAEIGRPREAQPYLRRARERLATGEDWRGLAGSVALAEAAVESAEGRCAEAEAHYIQACATFRRYHLPWDEAETLRVWGRALLAAGDPAIAKFDAAVDLYRARGAGEAWIERLRADRTRASASTPATQYPTPPSLAYPSGLSNREVEVLRLLAAGHTSREIAAELVLSVRTIDRHIESIYAKTATHRRADATAFAIRHHLIPD